MSRPRHENIYGSSSRSRPAHGETRPEGKKPEGMNTREIALELEDQRKRLQFYEDKTREDKRREQELQEQELKFYEDKRREQKREDEKKQEARREEERRREERKKRERPSPGFPA